MFRQITDTKGTPPEIYAAVGQNRNPRWVALVDARTNTSGALVVSF